MALIERMSPHGLIVAEQSQDETAIKRGLIQIDDKLVLQKHPSAVAGGWVYKVLRVWSDDHPPDIVCTWADEYGRPLPLTSGILDMVNRLRVDSPHKGISVDEHNEQHRANVRKRAAELSEQVIDDHRAKVERGRVSVSVGGTNRKPEWAKTNRGRIAR